MDVKILSENEEEIEMKEIDDEEDGAGDKLNLNLEGAEVGASNDRRGLPRLQRGSHQRI